LPGWQTSLAPWGAVSALGTLCFPVLCIEWFPFDQATASARSLRTLAV